MSCTEIYGFDVDGNAYHYKDVPHAQCGALAVWRFLEKTYLPQFYTELEHIPMSRCFYMDSDHMWEIWDLITYPEVSGTDKICLECTFDKTLVRKEDLPKVIEAFRDFKGETSLKEQANILEELYNSNNCIAVGWNQVSTNSNNWGTYDYIETAGNYVTYNCIRGQSHNWLFG